MSGGSFEIRLDTREPQITWGTVTPAPRGLLWQIHYTSDEPVARAVLRLSDARDFEMDVAPTTLSILIPADAPVGTQRVIAFDAVGNSGPGSTLEIQVTVEGEVEEPPPPPPTGPSFVGGRPSRVVRRRVISKSTWSLATNVQLQARVVWSVAMLATLRLRVRPVLTPEPRQLALSARYEERSSASIRVRVRQSTDYVSFSEAALRKHFVEDELLLLGVLG